MGKLGRSSRVSVQTHGQMPTSVLVKLPYNSNCVERFTTLDSLKSLYFNGLSKAGITVSTDLSRVIHRLI